MEYKLTLVVGMDFPAIYVKNLSTVLWINPDGLFETGRITTTPGPTSSDLL